MTVPPAMRFMDGMVGWLPGLTPSA